MKVRRATQADAPAICDLINHVVNDTLITFTSIPKTPDVIVDAMAEGRPYWVLDQRGKTVGYACFGPFRSGDGYAATAEHAIAIAPAARGGGGGRALMDAVEAEAASQGIHILVAGISSANPSSCEFHANRGFEQVAHMPQAGRKWGQWLDLILMQKRLSPDESSC